MESSACDAYREVPLESTPTDSREGRRMGKGRSQKQSRCQIATANLLRSTGAKTAHHSGSALAKIARPLYLFHLSLDLGHLETGRF